MILMRIANPVQPLGFPHVVRGPQTPEFRPLNDALGQPVDFSGQNPQPPADLLQQAHEDFPVPAGGRAGRR